MGSIISISGTFLLSMSVIIYSLLRRRMSKHTKRQKKMAKFLEQKKRQVSKIFKNKK